MHVVKARALEAKAKAKAWKARTLKAKAKDMIFFLEDPRGQGLSSRTTSYWDLSCCPATIGIIGRIGSVVAINTVANCRL
jgi:hypothetical protein